MKKTLSNPGYWYLLVFVLLMAGCLFGCSKIQVKEVPEFKCMEVKKQVPESVRWPRFRHRALVIIDFNGHTEQSEWNNGQQFTLAPYTGPQAGIIERVRLLFAGYKINFTTSETDYKRASFAGKRMRCVVTPTSAWVAGGFTGIAFTGSMMWNSNESSCFVFSDRLYNDVKFISDIITHEVAHTIGLSHQKDFSNLCAVVSNYSQGKIMGNPFNFPDPIWYNQLLCQPQNDTLILKTNL